MKTAIVSAIAITLVLISLFTWWSIDEELAITLEEINLVGTNGKTIYIIDGITGSPGPYVELANYLNQKGYSVKVPILKNHGNKLSAIAKTTIEEIRDDLKSKITEENIILIGTCSGSLIALDIATDINSPVILINPPINKFSLWGIVPTPFIVRSDIGLVKNSSALTNVPRYSKYPTYLLKRLPSYSQEVLSKEMNNPILVIHSNGDIRSPESGILQLNKQTIELNNSGHLAYLDLEKDYLFTEVLSWLNQN